MENERNKHSSEQSDLTTASIAGRGSKNESDVRNAERRADFPRTEPIITPPPGTGAAAITGGGTAAGVAPARQRDANAEDTGPLFAQNESEDLRHKWDAIQVAFVDEPRSSVEKADHLVADTMKRLAEVFADERGRLEQQWSRGDNVSTEDLRVALRRYRSFFGRLLSV